jgi:hypothetical protein
MLSSLAAKDSLVLAPLALVLHVEDRAHHFGYTYAPQVRKGDDLHDEAWRSALVVHFEK